MAKFEQTIAEIRVNFDGCEIVIVEPRSLQALVIQKEAQRLDQVQSRAGVRAQAYGVTGIRRNLRLEQHDMKHAGDRSLRDVLHPQLLHFSRQGVAAPAEKLGRILLEAVGLAQGNA